MFAWKENTIVEATLSKPSTDTSVRPPRLKVVNHPLFDHYLTIARRKETPTPEFRRIVCGPLATKLIDVVTEEFPQEDVDIETPLCQMVGSQSKVRVTLIPVMRSGTAFERAVLELLPWARVAHAGMFRDPQSLKPTVYRSWVAENLSEDIVIILEPMLATAGSAAATAAMAVQMGAKPSNIILMSLVAAPEGIKAFSQAYPESLIVVGAVDERLDHRGYIVPGLGDAGDRLFGTAPMH